MDYQKFADLLGYNLLHYYTCICKNKKNHYFAIHSWRCKFFSKGNQKIHEH